MAAITEWRLRRVFAAAEEQFFGCVGGELNRFKGCSLVRTIAKGLLAGFTASAPEIAFSLGDFDPKRGFLGDIGGVRHSWDSSLAV